MIIFILVYLVSFVIHLIICYQDNKRHIFNVGDLLDEIEFDMCFPIINTIILIFFVALLVVEKLWKLFKLDKLWEKFRNIKLKK